MIIIIILSRYFAGGPIKVAVVVFVITDLRGSLRRRIYFSFMLSSIRLGIILPDSWVILFYMSVED